MQMMKVMSRSSCQSAEELRMRFGAYTGGDNSSVKRAKPAEFASSVDMDQDAPMENVSRPELEAKLEAIEARMDGRVASVEAKIDSLIAKMEAQSVVADAFARSTADSIKQLEKSTADSINRVEGDMRELRGDVKTSKIAIISTVIGTVVAATALIYTLQSNTLSAFQTASSIATSLAQATEQLKTLQEKIDQKSEAPKAPQKPAK